MVNSELFLTTELNLPSQSNELIKASDYLENIKYNFRHNVVHNNLTHKHHSIIYDDIVRVLLFVGNLSEPYFKVEDSLEKQYLLNFPHSPQLAKELWLQHYETIHHPFNVLKNRCFRLLEELDEEFIRLNKCQPQNWNI